MYEDTLKRKRDLKTYEIFLLIFIIITTATSVCQIKQQNNSAKILT